MQAPRCTCTDHAIHSKHYSRPSVAAFSFTIGVWCKQDLLDQRPPQNTAHTAHLVSLDSPLNVAPCPTKFTTCTRQKWSSSFDRAWWLLQLHHTEVKSTEM